MLERIDAGPRHLDAYAGVAPDEVLENVRRVARQLRGARVLHLNATSYGGGVSELLRSIVPLLRDVGVDADWKVMRGDERFFEVSKKIHNALQGADVPLSEADRETFLGTSRRNAAWLDGAYDCVVIHDPQPAGILGLSERPSGRWIWRCHIDTASPNLEAWNFLRPFLAPFDAAIFTMATFVPKDMPVRRVEVIPPAIDPLSPKNLPLHEDTARRVLEWIGIDLARPLVTQVSRFDPWKDPLGVIQAYRLIRARVPGLQLALVGSMAQDDPEGWRVYTSIMEEAASDRGIHVFTNLNGVGNIEVNAFQRLSSVILQKSLREGFGLVVSEALWKRTPVVAGRVGGISLQMPTGTGGILVDDIEQCAEATLSLLSDRAHARELADRGHDHVRQHFLIPRLLLDEMNLMCGLIAG